MTGDQVVQRRRGAAIGHVVEADAGALLEQCRGQVRRRLEALVRRVQPARIGLRAPDELVERGDAGAD